MKLYTEEEVRKAIELARDTHPEGRGYMQSEEYDYSDDEVIDLLTPIEMPSDEEIVKAKYEHEICVFADEYASYVLEQSKPGIKGAMVSMCAWTFFKNRNNEQQ